jgi:GntR family transcriptional repressor for pyruvate dehydrogenase complex
MNLVRSRDDLAMLLTEQISRGDLGPGELLPSERALSEEYGLSRSMVREALRTLAERRLIEVLPGRGSIVRQATVDDAVERMIDFFDHRGVTPRNLIEARAMIETTAAGLAAERASDEERLEIVATGAAMDAADTLLDRVRCDLAFHLTIVRAAKNPLVETMFHAIQPYIVELLFRSLTDDEVTRKGLAFHSRIVQAICERDVRQASREMREHLTLGLTLFGADIDRNLNLVAQDALNRLSMNTVTFEDLIGLSRRQ